MKVSAFMIPADKVVTCSPADDIQSVLDTMAAKKIGAVVVLHQSNYHMPVGIATKSDFVRAYHKGIPLTAHMGTVMSKNLNTVRDTLTRDDASKFFDREKVHHAVVLGEHGEFMGLISSWDIAVECARDARAWPWNRSSDGKFHKPGEEETPTPVSPSSVKEPTHTYLDMVDSLRFVTDT
jgi:CBS domain-containing protein